jgi:hypothetical protein
MKLLHRMNKNSLLVLLASSVLITSTLVACGGGGSGGGDSGAASSEPNGGPSAGPVIDNELPTFEPAYDLNGFKECGTEFGKDITLTVDTHVAYGLVERYQLVYLFNQKKGTVIKPVTETFGADPLPATSKRVYCKPVTSNNNEIAVFRGSLGAVKRHLESMIAKDAKSMLSSEELQLRVNRLKQTMYAVAESEGTLLHAFNVIAIYEKMRGGAFFVNKETKDGFPNENSNDNNRDIDRAVLTVQQGIHDIAFLPANLAKYKTALAGRKFNSHEWFPGKVKNNVKADSNVTYKVSINATMAVDTDKPSSYSQGTARRPTGYYLAAGDVAKVSVPSSMVGKGFVIQVGANVHDKTKKQPIDRPYRVTNRFPIVANVTEIANPNGGGIYIDVPYKADAGNNVTIEIQNAVPAPFFSYTALKKMTNQQWRDVQRKNPAPWADFMSDKFMATVPTSWIYNYEDPEALMNDWDKRIDVVSKYVGHNINTRNNQALYVIVDTSLFNDAFGIGYPTGNNGYHPKDPTDGNNKSWFLVPGAERIADSDTEFHELGHAQLFDNFSGEGEAAVNMLYIAVANQLYGKSIDEALGESMGNFANLGPHLTREVAAVNWMVTANFRNGKAMDISEAGHEVKYQQRGYAKYAEIAALFGWEKINAYYAQENNIFRNPAVAPDKDLGLNDDEGRILKWSVAAGADLTPLIHFWGIQPSASNAAKLSAAIKAAGLKPSLAVYNRLKTYQGLIPMDNTAFKAHAVKFLNVKSVADITGANGSDNNGMGWYAYNLEKYNSAEGQAAQKAFDGIFTKYFPNGRPS